MFTTPSNSTQLGSMVMPLSVPSNDDESVNERLRCGGLSCQL